MNTTPDYRIEDGIGAPSSASDLASAPRRVHQNRAGRSAKLALGLFLAASHACVADFPRGPNPDLEDTTAGKPQPDAGVEPGDASQPDAGDEPEPDAGTEPEGDAAPQPEGDSAPQPEGDAEPQPEGDAAPQPEGDAAPIPEGDAAPIPEGDAAPIPEGDAAPQPEGDAAPIPEGDAAPIPEGDAAPQPEGDAAPQPEGDATPIPEPDAGAICQASPEVCNGTDDDCDGIVDEFDPNNGAPCRAAEAFGICRDGAMACVGGEMLCLPGAPNPDGEICWDEEQGFDPDTGNVHSISIDNDCDGSADEGCVGCRADITVSCSAPTLNGAGVSLCNDNPGGNLAVCDCPGGVRAEARCVQGRRE